MVTRCSAASVPSSHLEFAVFQAPLLWAVLCVLWLETLGRGRVRVVLLRKGLANLFSLLEARGALAAKHTILFAEVASPLEMLLLTGICQSPRN